MTLHACRRRDRALAQCEQPSGIGRRAFLQALPAGLVWLARSARASERNNRLVVIGWLHLGTAWPLRAFRERLRELGWIEGENYLIEARFADNDRARLPALARELIDRRVDVIVTQTTLAAHVAKDATTTIPIVMAGCNEPVFERLVASIPRPGGNVTGVMHSPPGIGLKVVQLLRDAAPRVSRIAALTRPTDGPTQDFAPGVRDLGVTGKIFAAENHGELPGTLEAALRWGADALYVPPTSLNDRAERMIADFARAHHWPSIGGAREFPVAGGLMSYWASWKEIRRQAADYVDKILKGAQPGELPIQQPMKYELVLNVTTARDLGLVIPASLRLRADEIIQ